MPKIYERPQLELTASKCLPRFFEKENTSVRFSVPVNSMKNTWDFTDLENTTQVYLELQDGQKEDVYLKIRDGMNVRVFDTVNSKVKVHLYKEDGSHSIASGYSYFANEDLNGLNGVGKFIQTSDGFSVDYYGDTYRLTMPPNIKYDPKNVWCRHLAIDTIMSRIYQQHGYPNWKDHRDTYYTPENLSMVFVDQEACERKIFDARCGDAYVAPTAHFGSLLSGTIKHLSKDLKLKGNESKEFLFYVSIISPFEGESHALALSVKVKHEESMYTEDRNIYKVKLYDPNLTRNHISYTANSLRELSDFDFHHTTEDLYSTFTHSQLHHVDERFLTKEGTFSKLQYGNSQKINEIFDIDSNDKSAIFSTYNKYGLKILEENQFKKIS